MSSPYVLTNDLRTVFASLNSSLVPPCLDDVLDRAADMITTSLSGMYDSVEVLSSQRMNAFTKGQIMATDGPVVSLIPLTHSEDYPGKQIETIESSRTVRPVEQADGTIKFEDMGSMPRHTGAPPLSQQFEIAADNLSGYQLEVPIVDDVVFSGGTIISLSQRLNKRGVAANTVIANVAIQGGVDKLREHGITVKADKIYDSVADEVCMRDFIVGAPAGGRNLVREDGSYAAVPYLAPFGDVSNWASIDPSKVAEFSKTCLEASLRIWQTIGENVCFKDLAKPVFGCDPEDGIARRLQELLDKQAYAGPINPLRL